MADSARPLTPRGTPRSPRTNEAAAGAAAARPFVQRLRATGDDGDKILEVVKEAEREHDSLYTLSEIYGVALTMYETAQTVEDYDLSDLCVKRMRALCRLSPQEAREFHNRSRAYGTGRKDARMYEARAAMEERLGDTAKAIKMLQEGLRYEAQPEEALRRQLKKLNATESSSRPGASTGATTPRAGAAVPAPPVSPRQAPAPSVAMPKPAAAAVVATTPSPRKPAASSEALQRPVAAVGQAAAGAASIRSRPRLLDLGPPQRVLAGEQEEGNDGEEEEEEVQSCEEEVEDEEEEDAHMHSRLSTTMASQHGTVPLSPIPEADCREEVTCETAHSRASLPPPGSTAPTPRREAVNVSTPRSAGLHDLSTDSIVTHSSRSSKSISVNGVAYSQIHVIGRGGSSKVYLVHTPSGDTVALKRVTTDSAKQLEAFENEVELLLRLRGQEHVIQVIDAEVDRERGRIHIVMEAADMDLGRFLQSEPRLSLAKVQDIWRQMLQAVQVIHNARIVHSDLKPGNFVIVGGKIKVIDFGIAKSISNDTTNIFRESSVGTLSYMAPEAVNSGSVKLGRPSDIWALGIILYQMVYGHTPFAHLEQVQRMYMMMKPDLRIEFPEGHCLDGHSSTTKAQLRDILEGCLNREPRRRPSLADLLAHPFLRSTIEVQREALDGTVAAVMGHVMRTFGEAREPEVPDAAGKWQAVADEVWERLSGTRNAAADEASDFEGLAPLSAIATRFSELQSERDSAVEEKARLQARNAELEEQLSRLQSRASPPTDESKVRGKPRPTGRGFDDKENATKGVTKDGLEDNPVLQRLQASRQAAR